jgi:hypothetical protein
MPTYSDLGYHMTEYVDLAARGCDGKVGPYGCSGLAIVSKYKFVNVSKPSLLI